MIQKRNFQLSDALVLAYFSVAAYLLALAKEFGYLDYFRIPGYFINFNIFESISYLLITVSSLLLSYLVYSWLFRFTDRQLERLKKRNGFSNRKFLLVLFQKIIIPAVVPLLIFLGATNNITATALYFLIVIIIFGCLLILERRLLNSCASVYHKLITQICYNAIWLISNFIIFWSAGTYYAKNYPEFYSFDNGHSIVIYFSNNKMFTKNINENYIEGNGEFSIVNLNDSSYHFKVVKLKR